MKKKNSPHFKTSREHTTFAPKPVDSPIIVLGVDPGTLVTGYGVITSLKGDVRILASGIIRNAQGTPLPDRLTRIHQELSRIMSSHRPIEFAIESAFYGKNVQSALKLGHARGVSILAAASLGIPVSEYTPREIKKALTGNGNASKLQVQYMVRSILRSQEKSMTLDASDAIATALCHLQRLNGKGQVSRNWQSFVAAHPERVIS